MQLRDKYNRPHEMHLEYFYNHEHPQCRIKFFDYYIFFAYHLVFFHREKKS